MLKGSSQSGFSLVELLAAVLILAVGLLGLAELQITAMKANSQSSSLRAANSLIQQVMEEIVSMDPASPIFAADAASTLWPGPPNSPITVPGGGTYNITYTADADYNGVTNLCFLTVNVTSTTALQDVTGTSVRSVSATTLKRAF